MFKNIVYILVILGIVVGFYFYHTNQMNGFRVNLDRVEEKKDSLDKTLKEKDKEIINLNARSQRLKNQNQSLEVKIDSLNREISKAESSYDSTIREIDSLSLDSVAKVISQKLGVSYKIYEIHDRVYVAFPDTSTREIAKIVIKNEKLQAQNVQLKTKVSLKDSIIRNYMEQTVNYDSIMSAYKYKNDMLKSKNSLSEEIIEDQKDKIGLFKWIIVGELGLILILAL